MITLIPVTFSVRELFNAVQQDKALFVPCRGNHVIWDACYLDTEKHNEEDVLIRATNDLIFGDPSEVNIHDDNVFCFDLIDGEIQEEGVSAIDWDCEMIEHFPDCSKDQLLKILDLTSDKFLYLYNGNMRLDVDTIREFINMQREKLEASWIEVSKEFSTLDSFIKRLEEMEATEKQFEKAEALANSPLLID